MKTITKKELIEQGYSPYYASKIIRISKQLLVERGHVFYKNNRISRVPISIIEEILNISWEETNG